MRNLSAYAWVGAALLIAGLVAAPVFYIVAGSIALTALALSAILLGGIAVLLDRSLPAVPPQAADALLEAGLDNISSLLEELGVDTKAIYLPASFAGGKPQALIPLHANSVRPEITRAIPNRLLVEFGPKPDDVGLLVSTPGTTVTRFLEAAPGPSSSELEAVLARVLIGALDLATSVQVAQGSGGVSVNIAGIRLNSRDRWIYHSLGTPIASIAATLVAEGLGGPVTIHSEEHLADRLIIQIAPIH